MNSALILALAFRIMSGIAALSAQVISKDMGVASEHTISCSGHGGSQGSSHGDGWGSSRGGG
jgi:hypothetical protein